MTKKLIISENKLHSLVINESQSNVPAGCMRLSGTFAVCDIRNVNNRIYERAEYQKHVDALQPAIAEGLLGEFEHPKSMRTGLTENSAIKIERVEILPNGVVDGDVLVLDTPKGLLIQSAARAGIPIRISSRGYGSVATDGKVVLEKMVTYDVVGTGGFSQTNLRPVSESRDTAGQTIMETFVFDINEDDNTPEVRSIVSEMFNEQNKKQSSQVFESAQKYIDAAIAKSEKRMQLRIVESCKRTAQSLSEWAESNSAKNVIFDRTKFMNETLAMMAKKFGPVIESYIQAEQLSTVKKIGPVIESFIHSEQINQIKKIGPVIESFIHSEQVDNIKKIGPVIESYIKDEQINAIKSIGPVIESQIRMSQFDTVRRIAPVLERKIKSEQFATVAKIGPVIESFVTSRSNRKSTRTNVVEASGNSRSKKIDESLFNKERTLLSQIDEQINNATISYSKEKLATAMSEVFENSEHSALRKMPEVYKLQWLNSSEYFKGAAIKKSQVYEFKNDVQIEKFWDSIFESTLFTNDIKRKVNESGKSNGPTSRLSATLQFLGS